jgi:hypothetical protein
MLRFLLFCFFIPGLMLTSIAQSKFSSDFDFNIDFYSVSREEIIFDHKKKESLNGQYEFQTNILNKSSLKKDSAEIFQFIEAVNQGILDKKIKVYRKDYNSSIFKEAEPEYFFYRNDTELIEDQHGDIIPIAISDTVDYSQVKRIDCMQEWYYNIKNNRFQVQTIAFAPVSAIFRKEDAYFHGWKRMYTRKQGNLFSISNRKKIADNTNTIWAQRIDLSIPLNDFQIDRSSHKRAFPIKSVMEPHLSRILFNQIIANKVKAYIPNTNTEYTPARLDSLMTSRKDTEFIESEYGDVEPVEIIEPYTTQELGRLRIKQNIIFNKKSLKIDAKVERVILTVIVLDHNDEYVEHQDLFEIRYE